MIHSVFTVVELKLVTFPKSSARRRRIILFLFLKKIVVVGGTTETLIEVEMDFS